MGEYGRNEQRPIHVCYRDGSCTEWEFQMPRSMIPGLVRAEPAVEIPTQFIGTLISPGVVAWGGLRIVAYWAAELCETVAAGDRVRCMFVEDTQQVFVIEKIA